MLTGKRVAVLVESLYNEFEVWYPYYRLKEEGAKVLRIGSGTQQIYNSKTGLPVQVDADAQKVHAADFDAIIVPGGFAPDYLRREPAVVNLVRQMYQEGKVVAAICHGPWVLASADILQGKRVTSFISIKDDLVHAGARWEDAEVVQDGRLITARMPDDLPAFMRAVIAALAG